MATSLSGFLFSTLRGRLIVGVALVHAVMMALFIADLTARQGSMLLERQIEETTALSQTLAISAAGWIASNDIAGLQELAMAQKRYPELLFAMLADEQGRVLADTEASRRGLYLQDLPLHSRQTVLSRNPALVDIAVPAMIGDRHVGWARVGIGQKGGSRKLAEITRSGILYALAAIAIGSAIAWFMGIRITRRLYLVQQTMDAVSSGNRAARSSISGNDEAAVMAREFNTMLDRLEARDAELRNSEKRFRELIRKVQTAIILHDGQGAVLDSNNLAQELLGLSADQLTGKTLIDPEWHFLREDSSVLPVSEYPASRVLSSRQPLRGSVIGISRPDREAIAWVLVNAEPEYDEAGEMVRVIVSFVDITERKLAAESLTERTMLAEMSADIGCSLTTAEDLRSMLNRCANVLLDHLDAAFVRIWTYNAMEHVLELQASAGMYTRTDGSHRRVPLGKFKIGLIAEERVAHITNNVIGDPRVHDQEWALREGMVSFAGHPLIIEDKLVGVMALFSRRPLTDVTLRALSSVANEIAIGIDRKCAEEAIQLQAIELEEEMAERQMAQESLQEKALLLEEEIEKRQETQEELERLNKSLEERVRERTAELEEKNAELHRMNRIFVGRELRMVELKERIRELEKKSGT